MTMFDTTGILEIMKQGFSLAVEYWWVYVPVMLGLAAYAEWQEYQKTKYLASLKWTVLEVIPPPDVPFSSPKGAENIFAGLHASYGGGVNWKAQFFQGKVPDWFSFEIISNGGDIHLYIRCTEGQRNLVESIIFAQYPDAEIRVIEDYTKLFPEKFDPAVYDLAGNDFVFTKEPAFPIKTYPEFEEAGGKDEYARLDVLAPLFEAMAALRPGESLWLQYIIRPTGGDWVKDAQKIVDKLKGKKEEAKEPPLAFLIAPLDMLMNTIAGNEPAEEKKEEKTEFNLQKLTAAERKVLETVEFKVAKLAFKSTVRFVYLATKESFNGTRSSGISSMFKQVFYNNLNTFKPGNGAKDKGLFHWAFPADKGFFADERTLKKKEKLYGAYVKRMFSPPSKNPKEFSLILNTEEMATLWHLPGLNVKTPMLPRVQSKKGQPPAVLPTR